MSNLTMNRRQHDAVIVARAKGTSYALFTLIAVFLGSVYGPVGWLTYFIAAPPAAVVIITVIARLNDLGVEHQGKFWNVRRVGLVFTGLWAGATFFAPLVESGFPSWLNCIGLWGVALTLITSPHLPPWRKYVWHTSNPAHPHQHRRKSDDFESNP